MGTRRPRRPSARRRLGLERLEDRTTPAITVGVSPATFVESAGATAATATVTRSGMDLTQPLTVNLASTDISELTVPATVTIPADQASATFAVAAVNDTLRDGPQGAAVTATARVDGGTGPLASFVGQGQITPHVVMDVAALPDGKWVAVGYTRYDSTSANTYNVFVSRLLADGTPDPTFGAGGTIQTDVNGRAEQGFAVTVLPDGKILVLAYGNVYGPVNAARYDAFLLRYTPDGALDPTFGSGGVGLITTTSSVFTRDAEDLVVQPDGKIVIVGTGTSTWMNTNDFALARFNANGTLDTTFGTNGYRVVDNGGLEDAYEAAVQSDGKIVVVGNGGGLEHQLMARYTATGAVDTTFGVNGFLAVDMNPGRREGMYALLVDSLDRITTYGYMQTPGSGVDPMVLSRYLADGTLDRTFAGGGHYVAYDKYSVGYSPHGFTRMPDGRLVATFQYSGYYGPAGVAVFSADGVPIAEAVNPNTSVSNGPLAVGPDGVVAGVIEAYAYQRGWMNRYQLAPASAAATAAGQVTVTDDEPIFLGLTVAPTTFSEAGGPTAATATLVRSSGYAHETYTVTLANSDPSEVSVPASVTFAVGQTTLTFPVAALDDSQFDGTQTVTVTATAPNGVGGTASSVATLSVLDDEPPPGTPVLSLTLGNPFPEHAGPNAATGTVTRTGGDLTKSLTLNLSGNDATELTLPTSVVIPANQTSATFPLNAVDDFLDDNDQTVTVTASLAGTTITGPINYQNWRYGSPTDSPAAVAAMTDGRVLLAGNQGSDFAVRRFLSSGAADTSWGTSGVAITDVSGGQDAAQAMWLYPDGRVLVVGTGPGGANDLVLARYTAAGTLDNTFDTDGKLTLDIGAGAVQEAWDVTIAPDGKIVLAATVDRGAPTFMDYAVVRLNADGSRDAGFGTNGLTAFDFAQGGDRGYAVAVQPDGRVFIAGEAGGPAGGTVFGLARLTAAGALDATFGTGGKVMVDLPGDFEGATDVLLRGDGRVLAVGRVGRVGQFPPVYDAGLVQLNADGSLDSSFGVSGVRVQGDYGGTGVAGPVKAALQADGRLLVAATTGTSPSSARGRLMRFSVSGTQENFANSAFVSSVTEDVAITPTGDIFLAYSYAGTGWVEKYRTTTTTGTLTSANATVRVIDNEPFYPQADNYTMPEDGTLTVPAATGVMANDVLTRPIAPTVSLYTQPRYGTVSLAADGSFTYTPRADYFGQDYFTYRINDGVAVSNTAAVWMTVSQVNDAPTAAPDAYALVEDGAPLTVAAAPPSGTTPNLLVRYTFDEGAVGNGPAYDTGLAPANTGRFVNGASRSGSPGAGGSRGAAAFGPVGSHLTAGDIDAIDSSTTLTVSFWLNLRGNPKEGDVLVRDMPPSFPIGPSGTWGWQISTWAAPGQTPTASSFRPALSVYSSTGSAGYGGTVPLQTNQNADDRWIFLAVTIQPRSGGGVLGNYFVGNPTTAVTNPQDANFTQMSMGGGNDAPLVVGGWNEVGEPNRTPPAWLDDVRVYNRVLTLAELEAVRTEAAANLPLGVLANDSDLDGDTLTAELVTGPANGVLTLNSDGSFTYTPNPNFSGTDSFTYRASDGTATSAPTTVTLTVAPVPDVVAVVVNDGAAQRSKVTEVEVTFDTEVDPALLATAFALTRVADGATVGTLAVATRVEGGRTIATLAFSGANVEFGSLADGRWVLSVIKSRVKSLAGHEMAADYTFALHRLFGDTDGDGSVTNADAFQFGRAFGKAAGQTGYRADLDFDGDGFVTNADAFQFGRRFGKSV